MRTFSYTAPDSVAEAVQAMASAGPGARFYAGGTTLLDLVKLGVERHAAARGGAALAARVRGRDGFPAHPRRPDGPAASGGLSGAERARLASPVGLDLGARTPEETAVSIASEIIATRWGGTGQRLAHLDGPVHQDHQ